MTLREYFHVRLSAPTSMKARGNLLKLEDATGGVEAKWVQVAVEGEFLGYGGPDHPGFKFTRKTFEEVIANIHGHPSFKIGASGFGEEGVIPWDFSHASEQRPTEGSLPMMGAPAQGWSSDAQIRNGAGGKSELWMLTKFLEPARTFVLGGQYKWASVALSFESVDNETGEATGALVTSIALTNTPFIEGMAQLAATRQAAAGQVEARRSFFEAADSPEKAVEMMKEMFGIPETATPSDVGAELSKVSEWVTAGSAPIGVDVDEIVSSLRTIMNMAPFSSAQQVLTQAETNIANLGDQTAPLSTLERNTMEILKVLATLLGVSATQEAITAELESLAGLRDKLVALFALAPNKATTAAILQSATDANVGAETLFALCTALSVKDGPEAITTVATLQAANAELEKLKPEMLKLQKIQEDAEAVEAKVDVDRAIASNAAFDESMRPMFALSRKTDKAAFLVKYPVPEAGAAPVVPVATHLTQSVAAQPGGAQLAVVPTVAAAPVVGAHGVTMDANGVMRRPVAPVQAAVPAATGVLGGQQVNLSLYPGVNDNQRMIAHLSATRANFKDQTWEDQCEAAFLALAELKKAAA